MQYAYFVPAPPLTVTSILSTLQSKLSNAHEYGSFLQNRYFTSMINEKTGCNMLFRSIIFIPPFRDDFCAPWAGT